MNFSVGWPKDPNTCFTPKSETTVKKWGEAVITSFDNTNKIVRGNFNCKFQTQICDAVYINNGH